MGKIVSKYTEEERRALAEQFVREREETGITRRQFAERVGVSLAAVSKWLARFCPSAPEPVDVTDKLREAEISFSMDGHSFTIPESGLKRFLGAIR